MKNSIGRRFDNISIIMLLKCSFEIKNQIKKKAFSGEHDNIFQDTLLGPTGGSNPFSSHVYRGAVLASSPAVSFPSNPFQYPDFPFGTSFPLSATFSGGSTTYVDSSPAAKVCLPAQFLGPAAAGSSHYPRPYVVSFPDGSNNSSDILEWESKAVSIAVLSYYPHRIVVS